jgi:tripartite-type tricarboxylate transporter receptor subunit TctC
VIIENVTGGGGNIATLRAAQARPDGYTIEIGLPSTHALNGAVYSLSYDVLNDFRAPRKIDFSANRGPR